MKFVTTGLAVSAIVVSLTGAAFAQGAKIGTETRGGATGTLGSGPGASGRASGSTSGNVGVQAPGANVGVGAGVSGRGSTTTKGGTTGAGIGASGKIKGGVSTGN